MYSSFSFLLSGLVVERMLFIYAKLNPGQSYVQGMNEIIG